MPAPPLIPESAFAARLLTRRGLLRAAGVGGLLLGGATLLYRGLWKIGPAGEGHKVLTDRQYGIAQAVGEAIFPGPPGSPISAEDIHLTDFVDRYISELYEDNQRMFQLLFLALNVSTLASYGTTFAELSVHHRREVLADWKASQLLERRAGIQSLRFVYSVGYFENIKVRNALGIRFGCDLSKQFPELAVETR